MKLFRSAAALMAALAWSIAPAAYAQSSDPGPSWTLIDSTLVRYFLPGTVPPSDADLATGAEAAALANATNPSAGDWVLVNNENVHEFLPDGDWGTPQQIDHTAVGTRTEQQRYDAGSITVAGTPTKDPGVQETNTSKWLQYTDAQGRTIVKIPVYSNVHTPYSKYEQYGYDTRSVTSYNNTYREDRETHDSNGNSLNDTRTFSKVEDQDGAWVRGPVDPSLNQLLSQWTVTTVATTYNLYNETLASGIANTISAEGSKAASFLSDRGSGSSKTTLSGSKQRSVFKADSAIASVVKGKNNSGGGSIGLTPANTNANQVQQVQQVQVQPQPQAQTGIIGSWIVQGGLTNITIQAGSQPHQVTVDYQLYTSQTNHYDGHLTAQDTDTTWSDSLLGGLVHVSGSLNGSNAMNVSITGLVNSNATLVRQ